MIFEVIASKKFNYTGLTVVKKQPLVFSVNGLWKDLGISCDANGWNGKIVMPLAPWIYDNDLLDSQKAVPGQNYMKLMGKIGEITFEIGNVKNKTILMPDTGELVLFANDIEWLYFNNSGRITVTIS